MDLTIIIPVFNSIESLPLLFRDLDQKGILPIEVILVDDCSTDTSYDYLSGYCFRYLTKKVLQTTINSGPSSSRKLGFDNSYGDYVMFIDSDDRLVNNWRNLIEEVIKFRENADVYFFSKKYKAYRWKTYLENTLQGQLWGKLYKRSVLVNSFSTDVLSIRYGEDFIQSCLILEQCQSVVTIPEDYYIHSYNPSSLTNSKVSNTIKCMRQLELLEAFSRVNTGLNRSKIILVYMRIVYDNHGVVGSIYWRALSRNLLRDLLISPRLVGARLMKLFISMT